jgi:hypothetical protein
MRETITVQYVNPPKEGKKPSIKTTDGRYFNVDADALSAFAAGSTYEIESESWDFKGKTYHKIKSAKSPSASTNGSGNSNSDRSSRIERQHSQAMALAYAKLVAESTGKVPELPDLRKLTDHFQQDVGNAPLPVALETRGGGEVPF